MSLSVTYTCGFSLWYCQNEKTQRQKLPINGSASKVQTMQKFTYTTCTHTRIHAYTHGVTLLYVYMHAEKFDIVCMTCHVILYNETHALKGTCMPISIKSRVYNKKRGRVIALCNSCHTRSQPFITYVCLGLSN